MKNYTLENKVQVVKHSEQMWRFYSGVFGIDFQVDEFEGYKIYTGQWGPLELCLVPEAIGAVKAEENKMHYDVFVEDLEEAIAAVEQNGGRTNGKIGESDTERAIGAFDPDDNFIVFKQRK